MSEKARNKNEDEFAFGMHSATKGQAGKHGRNDVHANALSHDAVKLLKTQDAGYLRVVAGRGRKELRDLEEKIGLDTKQGAGKKIIFVDEDQDVSAKDNSQSENHTTRDIDMADTEQERVDPLVNFENTETSQAGINIEKPADTSSKPKSKKAVAAHRQALHDIRVARKRRKRAAEIMGTKLELLKKRQKEIMAAAGELELQRAKMARTVGGVNKQGVKWKITERKR